MKYFLFLSVFIFWCSSVVTVFADIAIPVTHHEPYPYKKEVNIHYDVRCFPTSKSMSDIILIIFSTPGPCDYTHMIYDQISFKEYTDPFKKQ